MIDVQKGVHRDYRAELQADERTKQRHVRIVMAMPDKPLPRFFDANTCPQLVKVKYNLTDNDMKVVKKPFGLGKKYWLADFKFVVKVGAADLRFQIQSANGVLSSDHENLEVEFLDDHEVMSLAQSQSPGPSASTPISGAIPFMAPPVLAMTRRSERPASGR